jgi:adenine-specific DNA-methyltransferase
MPAFKNMTMDERKGKLADLVNLFEKNKTFYTSKDFNESEVRSKFIDPFLECLNWDVSNKKGARPDHQEVTTEGRLKADGKTNTLTIPFAIAGNARSISKLSGPI